MAVLMNATPWWIQLLQKMSIWGIGKVYYATSINSSHSTNKLLEIFIYNNLRIQFCHFKTTIQLKNIPKVFLNKFCE